MVRNIFSILFNKWYDIDYYRLDVTLETAFVLYPREFLRVLHDTAQVQVVWVLGYTSVII